MNNDFSPISNDLFINWQIPYYNHNRAYIRHYCTKTIDEFINQKIKRNGQPDNNELKLDIENYFYLFNKRTKEKDEIAIKNLKSII